MPSPDQNPGSRTGMTNWKIASNCRRHLRKVRCFPAIRPLNRYYHALQIQDFLRAIFEDRPPQVTGDDGRRVVRLSPCPAVEIVLGCANVGCRTCCVLVNPPATATETRSRPRPPGWWDRSPFQWAGSALENKALFCLLG